MILEADRLHGRESSSNLEAKRAVYGTLANRFTGLYRHWCDPLPVPRHPAAPGTGDYDSVWASSFSFEFCSALLKSLFVSGEPTRAGRVCQLPQRLHFSQFAASRFAFTMTATIKGLGFESVKGQLSDKFPSLVQHDQAPIPLQLFHL
jgi:hypothetical protein